MKYSAISSRVSVLYKTFKYDDDRTSIVIAGQYVSKQLLCAMEKRHNTNSRKQLINDKIYVLYVFFLSSFFICFKKKQRNLSAIKLNDFSFRMVFSLILSFCTSFHTFFVFLQSFILPFLFFPLPRWIAANKNTNL